MFKTFRTAAVIMAIQNVPALAAIDTTFAPPMPQPALPATPNDPVRQCAEKVISASGPNQDTVLDYAPIPANEGTIHMFIATNTVPNGEQFRTVVVNPIHAVIQVNSGYKAAEDGPQAARFNSFAAVILDLNTLQFKNKYFSPGTQTSRLMRQTLTKSADEVASAFVACMEGLQPR